MKLRILLVNPWIYDFAAYNLWTRPLGLLKVGEYLGSFDTELFFIDCTDSFDIKRYGAGRFRAETVEKPEIMKNIPRRYRRYGIGVEEFVSRVRNSMPFDLVLITSIMSYWYPGVEKVIEIIRSESGDVPILLGGIYATLYYEHAARNSGADFIYRGALNQRILFALSTFGYKLKKKREPIPYYRLNLCEIYPFAPLLTAEGCPFACSYCASRLLAMSYQRRSPEKVLHEITGLCEDGVRDFAFYDDALLVEAEDYIKPILRSIIERDLHVRFHTPNGLHARFIDEELAGLMKKAGFKTIRLGLETVSDERQKATGNKVTNGDLERAVGYLKRHGFTKKEIGVYLMYGLPGQSLGEVREGVGFLKSLDVRVNLAEFSPIKGTDSWNELVYSGVINDDLDPLYTNNTVFTYLFSGYDPEEVKKMKLDVKGYNSA